MAKFPFSISGKLILATVIGVLGFSLMNRQPQSAEPNWEMPQSQGTTSTNNVVSLPKKRENQAPAVSGLPEKRAAKAGPVVIPPPAQAPVIPPVIPVDNVPNSAESPQRNVASPNFVRGQSTRPASAPATTRPLAGEPTQVPVSEIAGNRGNTNDGQFFPLGAAGLSGAGNAVPAPAKPTAKNETTSGASAATAAASSTKPDSKAWSNRLKVKRTFNPRAGVELMEFSGNDEYGSFSFFLGNQGSERLLYLTASGPDGEVNYRLTSHDEWEIETEEGRWVLINEPVPNEQLWNRYHRTMRNFVSSGIASAPVSRDPKALACANAIADSGTFDPKKFSLQIPDLGL